MSRIGYGRTARHAPESWMSLPERADMLSFRLTKAQVLQIAADTRLPGEIAAKYKTSAAIILRIQQKGRRHLRARLASIGEEVSE